MGLLREVQQLFIARPDEAKDHILYKWPERNIRMLSQLTVMQDETAVFFKDGEVVGTLESGRHTLDGKNIPFIGGLIDKITGDNILLAELYFVSKREFTDLPFGGQLDALQDPLTSLVLELRLFGEYSLSATEPTQLILQLIGTQQLDSNERITDWIRDQILKHARMVVAQKVTSKEWPIVGLAQHHAELEKLLVESVNSEIKQYGLKVNRFGNITISLKEEDAAMLKQFQRDHLYAQNEGAADAALKVGIGRGMESGNNSAGQTGVGLGVGIAMGADLLKKKD
jgi:membrane protease subunit (stomatin/prohibitin family)